MNDSHLNYKVIDIENWKRKEQYYYFKGHIHPFFNICSDINVTALKEYSKSKGHSFFILSYHVLLNVINQIDEFKYRILDDKVVLYDKIRAACTIARPDRTFGFGYFNLNENFKSFEKEATEIAEEVKNTRIVDGKLDEFDMVHTSVLPWVSFRSVEHSISNVTNDCIPKLVFGKLYEREGETYMPASVSGHHSFMDGYHAGEFFNLYEQMSSEPEKLCNN